MNNQEQNANHQNQLNQSNFNTSIADCEAQIKALKEKPRTKQIRSKINRLKNELNKLYASNKKLILEFETTNYEYLALIRSTNGYYKLFGRSALYYAYSLAPKLNLTAKLLTDLKIWTPRTCARIGKIIIKIQDIIARENKTV